MAKPNIPYLVQGLMDKRMAPISTDQALLLPDGLRVPINNASHLAIRLEYHKQDSVRHLEPKLVSRSTQDTKSIFRGYGQPADVALLAAMMERQAARKKNGGHHSNNQHAGARMQIRPKNEREAPLGHAQIHITGKGVIGSRVTKAASSVRSSAPAQLKPVFSLTETSRSPGRSGRA